MKPKSARFNPCAPKTLLPRSINAGVFPVLGALLICTNLAQADGNWTATAGGNWNTGGNWSATTVPTSGENVFFNGPLPAVAFTGNSAITVDTSPVIGTLTLNKLGVFTATFSGSGNQVLTLNNGITTDLGANLTISQGSGLNTLPILLGGNNAWALVGTAGAVTVSSIIDDGPNSYSITKTGTRSLSLSGANTFDGGITHRQGTINISGVAAATVLGNGTFTFGNFEGTPAAVTLSLNTGVSKTFTNSFVQDNAENNDAGQVAQISTSGGSSGYRTLTFNTGTFSTGPNYHPNQGLNLIASTGSLGVSEGAYFFDGSWAGYAAGSSNTAIRIGPGSVVLSSSAIAATGGYSINGNDATMGAKLILATASTTMPNRVEFVGGANGMRNSFGARYASGTSTQSGNLSVADTDGGNVFSQSSGATLGVSGIVSGAGSLRINDRYSFTSADTINSQETPTGIVSLTNTVSNTVAGGVTVVNGTLLVNGDGGFSGTGSGTVTVGTSAAAVVTPQGGAAVINSRVITGVNNGTAKTLALGQIITGTNIPGSSVITGITIGAGLDAANASTVVINNTILVATADVQFTTSAFSTTATLGGTGRISPTVPNGVLVRAGSAVSLVDGITEDLLIRFVDNGAGNLVPGTAVFSTGSTFNFELAAPGTGDRIDFTGLTTAGAGSGGGGSVAFNSNVVNLTGLSGVTAGEYTLFTFNAASKYTGTLVAGTLPAGITGASFTYNATEIKVTLTAGTPYTIWAGGAAFDADANNDGVKNGLAWMLGAANPNASALNLLPTATVSGGNLTLSTFNRVDPKDPAKLFVEFSNNLTTWTSTETPTVNGVYPTGNITITVAGSPPTQTVAVTVSSAAAAGGKLFARLKATEN